MKSGVREPDHRRALRRPTRVQPGWRRLIETSTAITPGNEELTIVIARHASIASLRPSDPRPGLRTRARRPKQWTIAACYRSPAPVGNAGSARVWPDRKAAIIGRLTSAIEPAIGVSRGDGRTGDRRTRAVKRRRALSHSRPTVTVMLRVAKLLDGVRQSFRERAPRVQHFRREPSRTHSVCERHVGYGLNRRRIFTFLKQVEAMGSRIVFPSTRTRGDYLNVLPPATSRRNSRICSVHVRTGRVESQNGSWSRLRDQAGFDRLEDGDKAARSLNTDRDLEAVLHAFTSEVSRTR